MADTIKAEDEKGLEPEFLNDLAGADIVPEEDDETLDLGDDAAISDSEDDAIESDNDEAVEEPEPSEEPGDASPPVEEQSSTVAPTVGEDQQGRRGGFGAAVLGGVVAAGIGVVASQFVFPDGLPFVQRADETGELASAVSNNSAKLDDAIARLDALPAIDGGAVSAAVSAVGDLQEQIGALADTLSALEKRVSALEARPAASGGGVSADVENEISVLRSALDTQKGELAKMLEEAQAKTQNAEEVARQTMARAAMTRVLVALDSGAGFEDALSELKANTDISISSALSQTAVEGVPTVAELQSTFPEAARDALAAARSGSSEGGIGNFLAKQLGARSVEPREGDDPDAVLSRAEAAIKDGRISDALGELDALPEIAQAPLADWTAQANLRLTATADAEALANTLNSQ